MDAKIINVANFDDYIRHDLATAENDFLVASGAGAYVKKTLAETRAILGILVDRGDPAAFDWAVGDFTTDGTWRDLDCSSIVPVGARFIVFKITLADDAVVSVFRMRKNGNTNSINTFNIFSHVANQAVTLTGKVACDSNRIVEYMGDNLTFTTLNVVITGWEF